jgi:hypothetical protein
MMDSLGDDVKMGMTKLLEATAALPPRPARAPLAFALLVPLAALCLRARRGA